MQGLAFMSIHFLQIYISPCVLAKSSVLQLTMDIDFHLLCSAHVQFQPLKEERDLGRE